MTIRFLFFICMIAFARCALSGEVPTVNVNRAIIINGVIAQGNILPLGDKLLKLEGKEPVDIVINSPGGEVMTGFLFINQMEAIKANGVTIRCFVPTMAASMAFQILVHCDERYVLDKAFLLWHRVRVSLGGGLGGGVTVTAKAALDLYRDLNSADTLIFGEIVKALNISKAVAAFHFERETLHVGSQLGELAPDFCTSYSSIPGLQESLTNTKIPGASPPAGFKGHFGVGEIVYIYTDEYK